MTKLAQIVVRLDGKKTKAKDTVTELYKTIQKPAFFNGHSRVYEPYAVEGGKEITAPPENQIVQAKYKDVIGKARKAWTELMDGTYQEDVGNTRARSDVIVDGQVVAKDVPVTTLMFLTKQWTDVLTFLQALPTPAASVDWVYDSNLGVLKSREEVIQQRTEKVPQVLRKFEPTERHPGQADVFTKDIPVGEYKKREFSGGCPLDVKEAMVERCSKIIEAIKVAREAANMSVEVQEAGIADQLFEFVFAPSTSDRAA